ncbi:MAG: hypothetical protein Q9M91_05665 [Candidatus Dojkabacteria bacterium]|nr:hypothetical protein [Candidatus Dojkabacteria bacterium]MDQ7021289.1 hypothetical protein [Candidatus Dojkabacteria bacterium]
MSDRQDHIDEGSENLLVEEAMLDSTSNIKFENEKPLKIIVLDDIERHANDMQAKVKSICIEQRVRADVLNPISPEEISSAEGNIDVILKLTDIVLSDSEHDYVVMLDNRLGNCSGHVIATMMARDPRLDCKLIIISDYDVSNALQPGIISYLKSYVLTDDHDKKLGEELREAAGLSSIEDLAEEA